MAVINFNLEVNVVDIIHRVGIKAPATRVYDALASLNGLRHWWTEEVHGDDKVGGTLDFVFRSENGDLKGNIVMEVQDLNAATGVRWRCVDGPAEWIGTDVTFDLSPADGQTIVYFGHRNWQEAVEFTSHCSMKWATFLLSLRDYVENGKGRPSPYDLKIDNWN